MRGNWISDLQEQVLPLLSTMRRLSSLDLRDNEVTRHAKYREQVIIEGRQLTELDGKTVRQQDRRYLVALANKKRQGRSNSFSASDSKKKRSNSNMLST